MSSNDPFLVNTHTDGFHTKKWMFEHHRAKLDFSKKPPPSFYEELADELEEKEEELVAKNFLSLRKQGSLGNLRNNKSKISPKKV